EPVWAIGTGVVATDDQAQDAHAFVRSVLQDILGDSAQSTRILYGGSVKPDNAEALLSKEDIDGALVGGASLKTELFNPIIAAAGKVQAAV
ncbi:MAG: triose-phosphate isomerase, partial [Planctomycetes bacterium]|nr:triose-phosphate isomerase [Planctomycetota bacterium]